MFTTPQEDFWAGEFGKDYISRNNSQEFLSSKINLFSKIISKTVNVKSCFEIGANIGLNIRAISTLLPNCKLGAIEINDSAYVELTKIPKIEAKHGSILEMEIKEKYDFVFSKTVLIHIKPELLDSIYEKMYNLSDKYICVIEYYNPSPVTVNYRGHEDRLFKRDFAGDLLKKYSNLKLIDYGFIYKGDKNFPLDDVTWFLLEK